MHFQLPNDVIELLKKSKSDPRSRPQYSIRLFCASSEWFRPQGLAAPPGAPPVTNRSIPIEYPSSPDVLLDDQVVPFKERGLRGKAGSAPPLDIDKSPRGLVMMPGRMATVTMSHTGPTPVSKKKEFSKVGQGVRLVADLAEILVPACRVRNDVHGRPVNEARGFATDQRSCRAREA